MLREVLFGRAETSLGRGLQLVGRGAGVLTLTAVAACGPGGGGESITLPSGDMVSASPAPEGSAGLGEPPYSPPASHHPVHRPTPTPSLSHRPAQHPTPSPTKTTFTEISDNTNGAPVFADNRGSAVPEGVPPRIPYGQKVEVKCYEPNASGMTSVTSFYAIEGGTWDGMRVVGDTMENGGGMGYNTVTRDPQLPPC